jgi:anaerobic nitric oxide reductase flavorubredoxin
MRPFEIKPGIEWIGVNDRATDLFEGLWPITREGISYNAYLVEDRKRALVDLSKSFQADEFFEQVGQRTDLSSLDYIVVNHMEPDHSGVINTIRGLSPRAKILGSKSAVKMLEAFYGIRENVRAVEDGETLDLGRKTLKFILTPMVHWPETMMTYETSERVLFSGDAFGGYGSIRGAVCDGDCSDLDFYRREAFRYFVNVLAKYSAMVQKAMEKIDVPYEVIAPAHGLVWKENPKLIFNLYRKWAAYAGKADPGITLVAGSMYGNTARMTDAVARGAAGAGIPLEIFDVTRTPSSYILPPLWSYSGVIVGAPTYETALFPPVAHLLDLALHKGIKGKKALFLGSYGWGGGARKHFEKMIEGHWTLSDSLEFNGGPSEEELRKGEELGRRFADSLKETRNGTAAGNQEDN